MDDMGKPIRRTRTIKIEDVRDIVLPFKTRSHAKLKSGDVVMTAFVSNTVPEDLLLIADDIRDILDILTTNALKYTDTGRVHAQIDYQIGENESTLSIIVADTGQGIDQKTLAVIEHEMQILRKAGPFPTLVKKSMNLKHIYKILNACDGDLSINTNVGRGTEFIVSFVVERASEAKLAPNEEIIELEDLWRKGPEPVIPPLAPTQTPSNAQADVFAPETPSPIADFEANTRAGFTRRQSRERSIREKNISFAGMRILVVEDIIANQEVLRSLLEPAGCVVTTADNGKEAVDMTNVQAFDAVLMDIRMPIMNGVIATEIIRRCDTPNQDIPIIALTADASEENNAHCLAAGADVFLTKPVVISELFSAIRYACSQRERRDNGMEQEQRAARA